MMLLGPSKDESGANSNATIGLNEYKWNTPVVGNTLSSPSAFVQAIDNNLDTKLEFTNLPEIVLHGSGEGEEG